MAATAATRSCPADSESVGSAGHTLSSKRGMTEHRCNEWFYKPNHEGGWLLIRSRVGETGNKKAPPDSPLRNGERVPQLPDDQGDVKV